MGMNYSSLVKEYRRDYRQAERFVKENFARGEFKSTDCDFGKLFVDCFGWEEFVACREKRQTANDVFDRHGPIPQRLTEKVLREAGPGAVTTAAFLNISDQFISNAFLERYRSEDFVFTRLIPEMRANVLDGEKIRGLSQIGDEAMVRGETHPYSLAGFGENWVFSPAIKDRGFIVPVTWEAVFNDRTGRVLEYAGDGGYWMGVNVEKRAIDMVIDENTTDHRYNWRGTVIATYGDNSGNHTWDNLVASNALVDHTDVDAAEQAFNGLTDPFTGEPIMVEARHIVAVKALEVTVARILNSTQILTHIGGYPTSGNPTTTTQANPWMNKYSPVTSRLLAGRLATDTDWFLGDVTKLGKRVVAEDIQVIQAPPNNEDEFKRRIVFQSRANERSAFVTVEPRVMVKNTA